jgi:IS1 family transposase
MSWWPFPPRTREVQLDEKWSFVFKKQENCTAEELESQRVGDFWDHVAFDPEHRLVLSVVFGKRFSERVHEVLKEVRRRLGGRVPRLITTDEYSTYAKAIRRIFGQWVRPEQKKGEQFRKPYRRLLPGLTYAMVHKQRENGHVTAVTTKVVFGTEQRVEAALADSTVSTHINTSFLERHNGTDRNRNSRKARRTYCFSKDWGIHQAEGYFTLYSYNFCWCVRTLAQRQGAGNWTPRTPAMAAGLTDHVWTLSEWLRRPVLCLSG